ncbi:MAG: YrhK family protein [Actinomycetota bacterium]|nr:YrhK family protein [Actinomycetota bacterium]
MTTLRASFRIPEGWIVEERRTVGPFITRERYRLPDGSQRTWDSRRHRKTGHVDEERTTLARPWWQPRLLGWWIAALFMIGSFLFALGAFPVFADRVDARIVGVTYFVGSIFFTCAAYLQYVQAVNAAHPPAPAPGSGSRVRLIAWQPDRIDWWSASVQSIGTVLFNISTFSAMDATFTQQQQERLVWAPDMLGSIAFMIASTLAWLEVCHGAWRWDPPDTSWKIVALNLGGSIAFQISAVAAFIRPQTGEIVSLPISNLGTFVGALAFLVGAALLIPEMDDRSPVG